MNFSRKDYLFITFYSMLVIFALYKLFSPTDSLSSPFVVVATIDYLEGESRTMAASDLSWKGLRKGTRLGEGSKVFTQDKARVKIGFKNGAVIELDALTLVTLNNENIFIENGAARVINYGKEGNLKLNNQKISDYKINEKVLTKKLKAMPSMPNNLNIMAKIDSRVQNLPAPPIQASLLPPLTAKVLGGHVPHGLDISYEIGNLPSTAQCSLNLIDSEELNLFSFKLKQSAGRFEYFGLERPYRFEVVCSGAQVVGIIDFIPLEQVVLKQKVLYSVSRHMRQHGGINLRWRQVDNAAGYEVNLYHTPQDKLQKMGVLEVKQNRLNLGGFEYGEYYFNVKALGFYGDKGESSELGFIKLEQGK